MKKKKANQIDSIFEDEKEWIDNADGLVLYDTRKYGRVHLAFFKKGE